LKKGEEEDGGIEVEGEGLENDKEEEVEVVVVVEALLVLLLLSFRPKCRALLLVEALEQELLLELELLLLEEVVRWKGWREVLLLLLCGSNVA
jgi:hypothetical protein